MSVPLVSVHTMSVSVTRQFYFLRLQVCAIELCTLLLLISIVFDYPGL